jgi:hypothetical protein
VAEFVAAIERELPAARGRLTHGGPRIPIPPRLDGRALGALVADLPHTAVGAGIRQTLARFQELAARGQLDVRDLPAATG